MAQEIELIFSHKFHAEEVNAACTDCHSADESALPTDNLLPDMDKCYTCHDSEEECTRCHKDPDNAVVYPRITDYIAKFSHKEHKGKSFTCEKCHENVSISVNIFDKHDILVSLDPSPPNYPNCFFQYKTKIRAFTRNAPIWAQTLSIGKVLDSDGNCKVKEVYMHNGKPQIVTHRFNVDDIKLNLDLFQIDLQELKKVEQTGIISRT